MGAEGRSQTFVPCKGGKRFGLETCHPSVEEFTAVELRSQHLRGVGNVSIRTWERAVRGMRGGSRKETFVLHSTHIFSCFSLCGDCGVNVLDDSFPSPSTKQKFLGQPFGTCFLPSEARVKSVRRAGQSRAMGDISLLPSCASSPGILTAEFSVSRVKK